MVKHRQNAGWLETGTIRLETGADGWLNVETGAIRLDSSERMV